MSNKLAERLLYAATERCPCGYGFAYDTAGKIYTESGSPFVIRPDQWECAGTLLYRAEELSESEARRVLAATHSRPLSFATSGVTPTRANSDGPTTREPIIPANDEEPRP